MGKTKYNYIIFHKNCMDGFTGFYIFIKSKCWAKNPIVYPDVPFTDKVPPNIKNKNVIVIDVAYKPQIVEQIAEQANKLLFIDHHKTIVDDIKNLNLQKPHKIIYDVNECGASLTWNYFFNNKKMPTFVHYIKDNDLGNWKLKNTYAFISYIETKYSLDISKHNLKKWDKLLDKKYLNKLIEKGRLYNEYKTHLIHKYSKNYTLKKFPNKKYSNKHLQEGKHTVAVVQCGCPSVSMLGKYIVENIKCDFCIIWNYNIRKNKYTVSLRSNKVDIGTIAKDFGGGGHKFAAAFSININNINELFV